MKPVAVIPMNDPEGVMVDHLTAIEQSLKKCFEKVILGVTAKTRQNLPAFYSQLESDNFYQVIYQEANLSVGEEFSALYLEAAASCHPDQIVHLCFIDRVAYALQSTHKDSFEADIEAVTSQDTPLIFQRSSQAWDTHPSNYRALEQIVTNVGEMLFGKSLDFAWCHLVMQARRLGEIVPNIQRHDFGLFAEFVLLLRDEAKTKAVDWLAWEDPFIMSQDRQQLKWEREQSVQETQKRLGYVIPMLQLLSAAANA